MMSLHPSHVMSAINGGDEEIVFGLDWIRTWALKIAEDDTDHECSSVGHFLWSIWHFERKPAR